MSSHQKYLLTQTLTTLIRQILPNNGNLYILSKTGQNKESNEKILIGNVYFLKPIKTIFNFNEQWTMQTGPLSAKD